MHYDAFISYSHGADARLAPVLQRALHRFAKSWWKARAVTVFRDETSLAAAHSLPDLLIKALNESAFFILMASPAAACSKWVADECDYFAKHRDSTRMLIVLSEGEIAWDAAAGDFDWARTDALPERLKGVFRAEPLYVDLRWARPLLDRPDATFNERDPRFLAAVARLSAALRGVSVEAIAGEERRQHRKSRRVAYGAVSAIALLAAGASAGAWIATENAHEANRQRADAEAQRRLAEQRRFEAERERAEADAQRQLAEQRRSEAERERAEAERQRSAADTQRKLAEEGRVAAEREKSEAERQRDRATRSLDQAVSAVDTLLNEMFHGLRNLANLSAEKRRDVLAKADRIHLQLAELGDTPAMQESRAKMLNLFVGMYQSLGSSEELLRRAEAMTKQVGAILERNPDSAQWKAAMATAKVMLGVVKQEAADSDGALEAFTAARAIATALAESDRTNSEYQSLAIRTASMVGHARMHRRDLKGALEVFIGALAAATKLVERDPDRPEWQHVLSLCHAQMGAARMAQFNPWAALQSFRAALQISAKLARADPRHPVWSFQEALNHDLVGSTQSVLRNYAGALASFEAALAIRARLAEADRSDFQLQDALVESHFRLAGVQSRLGNAEGALRSAGAALAISITLNRIDPRSLIWQRQLAITHRRVGEMKGAHGDIPGAIDSYATALSMFERMKDSGSSEKLIQTLLIRNRSGAAHFELRDSAGALRQYQAARAVIRQLRVVDPNNLLWQYEVVRTDRGMASAMAVLTVQKFARAYASIGR